MGKKKVKKEGEQKVGKRVVEEEERKESTRDMVGVGGYLQQQQQGGGMMGWNWEENMPLVGGVVDEQMSWGSTWFPGWDMDLLFLVCRWNVEMPAIIAKSISILSDAGLGMAMFSLGQDNSLLVTLQKKCFF